MSRRSHTLGRLGFLGVLACSLAAGPLEASAQEPGTANAAPSGGDSLLQPERILERQVRITRAATGEVRVVELLRVALPSGTSDAAADFALILLQPEAGRVRGLGGDVQPERVVHTPPHVSVLGPLPDDVVRLAFEYRFSRDVPRLTLAAAAPVDELLLFIDRGGIAARVDPSLSFAGEEGSRAQPIASYRASELDKGEALEVKLVTARIGWRERIAVLAAATLAAAAATMLVVRRGSRERSPPGA